MNIINFPTGKPAACLDVATSAAIDDTECRIIREFALKIAAQLHNDVEINHIAPLLVDKVIVLLMKESRCNK
ncbi:hypothetical protein [Pantoea sp.]|uniref:hypothetical protein n=1 Tax=Pantoea sp. TaxID=69393 RepID=UPI0031D5E298